MTADRKTVIEVLSGIVDPAVGKDIWNLGLVRALSVEGGAVRFVLEVEPDRAKDLEQVRQAAEKPVGDLPGVDSVSAVMTAHSKRPPPPDLGGRGAAQQQGPARIAGVDRILAIASGKGGVGKSTRCGQPGCCARGCRPSGGSARCRCLRTFTATDARRFRPAGFS